LKKKWILSKFEILNILKKVSCFKNNLRSTGYKGMRMTSDTLNF